MSYLRLDSLPDPGDRYTLQDEIGTGVCAKVYKAIDTQAGGKIVAVKIQNYENEMKIHIEEEYRTLRDYSGHPNLLDFYGVYRKKQAGKSDEIWFILEYCGGGTVIDLIRKMHSVGKRMSEEQISFILRETAKGLIHLHTNHIIHRDVRGRNILLMAEGEVKLCDFGLSRNIKTTLGKRGTCIGSPNWMAPEIFTGTKNDDEIYGSRADVWSFGITAIEIGDGNPPFGDMHPTRVLFQIVRNPPPTLYRPANWSQHFNDFIAECLEKNPEHRPFMIELMEHPFFTELPENDYHLSQELKFLLENCGTASQLTEEVAIFNGCLKKFARKPLKMYVEDLAALERLTEEPILDELEGRMNEGHSYTFVGDVLLSLNSNDLSTYFNRQFHNKYLFKSRSDNAPHIFAVADKAFQDMLHHEDPQHIILSGESYSGKTTNMKLLIKHLLILGEGHDEAINKVTSSLYVLEALVNAGTPVNPNSTRCVMQSELTFSSSGKVSGAINFVNLLEKSRVSFTDMNQCNFHIFYYFYDTMETENRLEDYSLEAGRDYRYLRIPEVKPKSILKYIRDDHTGNVERFREFERNMIEMEFQQDQLDTMYNILAAILILGDVRYNEADNGMADLENPEVAHKVAKLLKIDEKKFTWALLNYCVVEKGSAERRRHTADEARDARDVLAAAIYTRLVDWTITLMNQKMSLTRAIFGDLHSITLVDMFGFECFHRNRMEQLFVNCLNEQMQYHYNQRMFVWEMVEQEEEQIPVVNFHFYDNKLAVEHIMNKSNGLLNFIIEATRGRQNQDFITSSVSNRKSQFLKRVSGHEFSLAHYTGKVTYDARDFADKNRDFLPPEMVETLRASSEDLVKTMFTNPLSKSGNLTMAFENQPKYKPTQKSKWGAALVAEKQIAKKLNTLSHGQYSQIHRMRTLSCVFRATSLELLKKLSIAATSSGVHFVRCIRADLEYKPRNFQSEMVRQQLKAMAIVDTAVAGQKGFPHRIPFQEFLRRYKFLAFDFNENVDLTRDNCRLLLIRLKMEGWVIGKTKVFLKYYNVEYLSRLYETQVKKIIKVQAMMRAFLAKRNMASKLKKIRQDSVTKLQRQQSQDLEKAAIFIQKAYRGYIVRKQYGPLISAKTGKIDSATADFIKSYARRWKAKTIFQVLLQYRAARYQDLVNFSQQVHIFNQRLVAGLTLSSSCVLLERIDSHETSKTLLGPYRQPVWKLPFRLDEIPYFDTTYLCDPIQTENIGYVSIADSDDESWDAPFKRRDTVSSKIATSYHLAKEEFSDEGKSYGRANDVLLDQPFCRDPNISFKRRAPLPPTYHQRDESISSSMANSRVYSPKPYARVSVENIRDKFDDPNVNLMGNKMAVYKKRPAPIKPITDFPPDDEQPSELEKTWMKKRPAPPTPKKDWEPKSGLNQSYSDSVEIRKIIPNASGDKITPIKEMQLIAQRNSEENNDEEDPPFNFQGMLRKTKYNRESMKRANESKMSLPSSDKPIYQSSKPSTPTSFVINKNNINNNNDNEIINGRPKKNGNVSIRSRTPDSECYVESTSGYTNVVYHSKIPDRPKSCQGMFGGSLSLTEHIDIDANDNVPTDRKTPTTALRKLSLQQDNLWTTENPCGAEYLRDENENSGNYVREEIAPGVILEGYADEV